MAKMVNINREVEDAFYRYKMPLMQAKVEGRGNGIKTAIPNMVDVAKALDRPPSYPTKYLGVELGAQTQMYPADERYIVNGAFEAERFQELLDGFIKKFVLCQECKNPETRLRVTSKKQIEQACAACGYRTTLPLTHRLTTYILNNPPNATKDKKGKSSKEDRRKAKNAKARGEDANAAGADAAASKPEQSSSIDIKGAGGQKSAADMRAAGAALDAPAAVEGDNDDDDDWSIDVTEEAVRARTAELGTGVTHLTMTTDLERPMAERLDIFHKFVTERLQAPKFPAKEIIGEAERLDCKEKGSMILVQTLWSGPDTAAAMKKYQAVFQRFTFDNAKAQKYTLQAFEKLIEQQPELLDKTTRLMKMMYDLDLVEEDGFLDWAKKVSDKSVSKELAQQIHAKAKPFIEWLKAADEEESSEDENIGFANEPTADKAAEAKKAEEKKVEDEIDIDDI